MKNFIGFRIRGKKTAAVLTCLAVLAAACSFAAAQEKDADDGKNAQETAVAEPSISAETAVLIDAFSGRVLYDRRMDAHMYPASTTKIMTAMLAVEEGDPQESVTVSENAAGQEGSSVYLEAGEKISMKDLLYGMMLRSGNDAATAVAEAIGGDTETFAAMMNERAASLGLRNSHFVNPSGLQNEDHYSSAYDLAMITREALKNDLFRQIVSSKTYQAQRQGAEAYKYFYNKNKTVFQYEGATGIKIGYTTAAGRCLVASAEREGTELIAVVLNDPDWFEDAYRLLDYGFEAFRRVTVAKGERPLISAAVMQGEQDVVRIGADSDIICLQPKGEVSDLGIIYDVPEAVKAPVSRWEPAGRMKIYSDGEYICSKDLYYLEDIGVQ